MQLIFLRKLQFRAWSPITFNGQMVNCDVIHAQPSAALHTAALKAVQ